MQAREAREAREAQEARWPASLSISQLEVHSDDVEAIRESIQRNSAYYF